MNSKIKGLSANTLKYLAIIAMTIDHTALVFVSQNTVLYYFMRTVGRLTAPIMCYFIAEGFHHTRSRRKYLTRTAVFAVISQPFYFLMVFGRPPESVSEFLMNWNVMYTFSVSLIMLIIADCKKLSVYKKIILIAVCFAFADVGDWAYVCCAWVLVFHMFRGSFKKQAVGFIGVSVVLMTYRFLPQFDSFAEFSYQYGVLLSLVPLCLYNGKRGGSENRTVMAFNKWLFYVYYPLHAAVLVGLKIFLA